MVYGTKKSCMANSCGNVPIYPGTEGRKYRFDLSNAGPIYIHWIQTGVITVPADGLAPHMFSSMFICLSRFINTFHLPYDTIHNGQLDLTAPQVLTHLPLDKMAANLADDIFNAFSSMKRFVFWLEFHWSFFLGVQLTIGQHWFR